MRGNKIIIVSLLIVALLTSGCATILAPNRRPLEVASQPQGAEVLINGEYMGRTPVRVKLKPNKSYTIEFRKQGYETATRFVSTEIAAGWLILDLVVGVFPVVVDAITGAWYKLDQKSVDAYLMPE